ncbi:MULTISPECIES: copper resistance protein B [unclassified Rudaea]|uniref:copper resistance protein B n=1 Tax=unclassified Rudaea TaxID=2627037 RepID=UPI0010F4902B|nr:MULTISPECIES: copper resistance protein B [unclassified Rudaea]
MMQPRILTAALTLAFAQTGAAQTMDHSQMPMPMPESAPAPSEPAKPQAKKPQKKRPPSNPSDAHSGHAPTTSKETMDHAAMGHGTAAPPAKTDEHAAMGHTMPASKAETDASMSQMDHAAMDHGQSPAPTQPLTPIPPLTDADRAAAVAPQGVHPMPDNAIQSYVLLNRLEAWNADPGTGVAWEGLGWIGTDLNRLWLRSEGERVGSRTESAYLEALYGRSISTWWDVVIGVRQDFKPGDSQSFAAIGILGLAPQKFEIEATAYLGERGQTLARIEAEYDVLLTNRLLLQPLVEVNLYGKTDRTRGIGSGLSTAEAGLRLRYEITRQFAPYIGVVRERAFGNTAELRRNEFDRVDDTRIVAGFRIWF